MFCIATKFELNFLGINILYLRNKRFVSSLLISLGMPKCRYFVGKYNTSMRPAL